MPKRKPRTQKVACPETYVDAIEGLFDEAIAAALEGKGIPARHRDAVRVMLIQMKSSTMDAIWEHVDPIDDPAADAVPQPLDRALIARIAEAEQRLEAASDRVKRLRSAVPVALKEAAETASSAAEAALTGPVDTAAGDDDDQDADASADAAAAASRQAATAALDAGQLLRSAAAAVQKASGLVEGVAGAVAMETSLGVTGADRALEGKGVRHSARRR